MHNLPLLQLPGEEWLSGDDSATVDNFGESCQAGKVRMLAAGSQAGVHTGKYVLGGCADSRKTCRWRPRGLWESGGELCRTNSRLRESARAERLLGDRSICQIPMTDVLPLRTIRSCQKAGANLVVSFLRILYMSV